jgi:hypothetical protein
MNRGERKVPLDIACIMTGFAFVFDLTNVLLEFISLGLGGFIMDIVSIITFSLWFEHYGVHMWGNKNMGWTLLAAFIDPLPFADLLFPWTFRVASLAFTERHEVPTNISGNVSNFNVEVMPDHFRL